MAEDTPQELSAYERLSDRQRLWVDEFCKHGIGTKASRSLGLKGASARTDAWRMLTNADVLAAKAERLAAASLGALETTKLVSDVAQTRLNDFFTIRKVQGYEQEEHYLSVLAERKREEIAFILDFATKNGMPLIDAKGNLVKMGTRLHEAREALMELELQIMAHGPDAVMLVPGKPVPVQVAELDLVKLAKAKETGRIKSYSLGREGLKVETYDALGALDKLARMHGLYEKDNRQLAGTEVEIVIGGEDETEA